MSRYAKPFIKKWKCVASISSFQSCKTDLFLCEGFEYRLVLKERNKVLVTQKFLLQTTTIWKKSPPTKSQFCRPNILLKQASNVPTLLNFMVCYHTTLIFQYKPLLVRRAVSSVLNGLLFSQAIYFFQICN